MITLCQNSYETRQLVQAPRKREPCLCQGRFYFVEHRMPKKCTPSKAF